MHCCNSAKRDIHTFKDHFIAGLWSTDPKYPVQEWDNLRPQATMTLNLLCTSCNNPKLSAYAAIFGIHYCNQWPLAPPVTKLIVHENSENPRPWSPYGTNGWYVGPSMEYYRCVQCFMPAISSVRKIHILTFFPSATPFPKMDTEYYLQQ